MGPPEVDWVQGHVGAHLVELGERAAVGTPQRREPRRVRGYSIALATTAVSAGVALAVAGAELPPPGPVLLLSIAVALCINRFAFFTSEQAATAEAAVLLAAVVAFRADAAFLGPLFVALLVGPLDTLHWHQRAYIRMAHNAGNRAEPRWPPPTKRRTAGQEGVASLGGYADVFQRYVMANGVIPQISMSMV